MEFREKKIKRVATKDYPELGIAKGDTYWEYKDAQTSDGFYTKSRFEPSSWEFPYSEMTSKAFWLKDDFEFDPDNLRESVRDYLWILKDMLEDVKIAIDITPKQIIKEKAIVGDRLLLKKEALEEWIECVQSVNIKVDPKLTGKKRYNRVAKIITTIRQCAYPL